MKVIGYQFHTNIFYNYQYAGLNFRIIRISICHKVKLDYEIHCSSKVMETFWMSTPLGREFGNHVALL
jgi:hypothetical protein